MLEIIDFSFSSFERNNTRNLQYLCKNFPGKERGTFTDSNVYYNHSEMFQNIATLFLQLNLEYLR